MTINKEGIKGVIAGTVLTSLIFIILIGVTHKEDKEFLEERTIGIFENSICSEKLLECELYTIQVTKKKLNTQNDISQVDVNIDGSGSITQSFKASDPTTKVKIGGWTKKE